MSEDLVQQVLKMMTEEQKAELISKLSKTDELRDVNKVRQETQPPQETRAPDDFTMTREKPKQNSIQVEVKKRENLFTDDGVEHKDEQNVTPQISLTERNRHLKHIFKWVILTFLKLLSRSRSKKNERSIKHIR